MLLENDNPLRLGRVRETECPDVLGQWVKKLAEEYVRLVQKIRWDPSLLNVFEKSKKGLYVIFSLKNITY